MDVTALEMIAIAAREGRYCDPRDPKGSRAGLTYSDICGALGYVQDKLGANMALMVGTQDVRKAEEIMAAMRTYVTAESRHRRIKSDAAVIDNAVERAISDSVYSPQGDRAGSVWYDIAIRYLMARAEAAAEEAIRSMLSRVAA